MLPSAQIIRTLSSKMQLSTSDLLSSKEKLNEEQLSKIKDIGLEMKKYPIFYVDIPARPIEMYETILEFCNQRKVKAEKKTLIVTIDFVSLCKGNASDSEKDIVDSLYKTLVEAKKKLYDMGIRVIFIALSQLNRDIESVERRDPKYQFPTRNDLYSASSIYTNSDIVIISHNPSVINGIEKYGPYNWDIKDEDGRSFIYWHIIKNRMGKNAILKMKEDFSNSKVVDA